MNPDLKIEASNDSKLAIIILIIFMAILLAVVKTTADLVYLSAVEEVTENHGE